MPVRLYVASAIKPHVTGDYGGGPGAYFGIATFGTDEDVLELLNQLPLELNLTSKVSSISMSGTACAIRSVASNIDDDSTVARMDLTVIIETIRLLNDGTEAKLFIDNEFIYNAIARGWPGNWQRRNWYTKKGTKVLHADLWKQLIEARKNVRIMSRTRYHMDAFDEKMLDFVNGVVGEIVDE